MAAYLHHSSILTCLIPSHNIHYFSWWKAILRTPLKSHVDWRLLCWTGSSTWQYKSFAPQEAQEELLHRKSFIIIVLFPPENLCAAVAADKSVCFYSCHIRCLLWIHGTWYLNGNCGVRNGIDASGGGELRWRSPRTLVVARICYSVGLANLKHFSNNDLSLTHWVW